VQIVYDSITGYGLIAGILAGMLAFGSGYSICLGCDLPFISPGVIDVLFEYAKESDAAIPEHYGVLETLHAVYSKSVIEACRNAMEKNEHTIRSAISYLNKVVLVPAESLRRFDPDLRTFLNVNYPEDLGVMA
jgi:molybdopterin-guanine dinucleotide biosynthesis protein A